VTAVREPLEQHASEAEDLVARPDVAQHHFNDLDHAVIRLTRQVNRS
jgi:hypothetical protein